MSTIDLKCELVQEDEFIDQTNELDEFVEGDSDTTECGRIVLDLRNNIWGFWCSFCNVRFLEISEFTQHITNDHFILLSDNNEQADEDEFSKDAFSFEIASISSEKSDEQHIDETETIYESVNNTIPSAGKPLPNNTHKCEFCDKSFRFRCKLREHLTVHTNEYSFKCEQCPKTFRTKQSLNLHGAVHNISGDSFKCTHCDQTFKQHRYLQMHIKYHQTENKYPCSVCGKTHRTASQLEVHMVKHTAQKKYICDICGYRYRLPQHLVVHHKQKHENKRDFKCNQCDKAFNTLAFLNTHKVSHSKLRSHTCAVCGMGFIWRKNLNEHLKLHSGKKDYKCEFCGKEFAQKSGLTTHIKTHINQVIEV